MNGPATHRSALARSRTTLFEQSLLVVTIVLLPLQDHIKPIGGFSILAILFGVLAVYVLLNRAHALSTVMTHPVFLAAYALVGVGFLIESFHPHSSYVEILRTAQMIAGAALVASLCRDRRALQAGVYAYLAMGVWLAAVLFLTSYGVLREARAADFQQASQIRREAFAEILLYGNLNSMAFQVSEGAVVGLALALTAGSIWRRILFSGIALFCLVATFLPLSRSGVAIVIVSCTIVLFGFGVRHAKSMLMASLIVASILIWVPEAVFARLTFSTKAREGKIEGRARVFAASVENLPKYGVTGVGAGNFWTSWGSHTKFAKGNRVSGAHNMFVQIMIYWGICGLLLLVAVIWQAYRCLPMHVGREPAALCLLGISVSLLMLTLVTHNLYSKEFSLGLGMLVGARRWIWAQVNTSVAPRWRRPRSSTLKYA